MGLDNGIDVKYDSSLKDEYDFFKAPWQKEDDNSFQICYMRKWWGVRNDMVRYLSTKYHNDNNAYEWILDEDDLNAFIDIYLSWNKEQWDEYGSSIWYWDEDDIQSQIIEHIKKIRWVLKEITKHPGEITCVFYDSY